MNTSVETIVADIVAAMSTSATIDFDVWKSIIEVEYTLVQKDLFTLKNKTRTFQKADVTDAIEETGI